MSNKTHSKAHHLRQQKREEFSTPVRRNSNLVLWIVIVGLLGTVAYLVASRRLRSDPTNVTASAKSLQTAPETTDVRIPLSEFSSGEAKFYDTALANGTSVRFFAIKTSDGVYRAALDACPVCFDAHKGYYQDGNDMVCRKCGRHFSVNSVGYGTSGCHPVSLHGTVDGTDLLIRTSDLENGSQYF